MKTPRGTGWTLCLQLLSSAWRTLTQRNSCTSWSLSGGDRSKSNAKYGYCNSESYNANLFTTEACQKFCKAFKKRCNKYGLDNHISVACRADKLKKCREEKAKKASVKEASAVEVTPASTGVQACQQQLRTAAPSPALNSVRAVGAGGT